MQIWAFIVIAGAVQAQYNQKWEWIPIIDPNTGQTIPDPRFPNGVRSSAAWRPDYDPGTPLSNVLFPGNTITLESVAFCSFFGKQD